MQALYQQLTSAIRVLRQDGVEEMLPPTPVMLHAARAIKQLDEINANNNNLIQQLQHQQQEFMGLLAQKDATINALATELQTLRKPT
jgi:ABC-type transporter Mla subunit MlaD